MTTSGPLLLDHYSKLQKKLFLKFVLNLFRTFYFWRKKMWQPLCDHSVTTLWPLVDHLVITRWPLGSLGDQLWGHWMSGGDVFGDVKGVFCIVSQGWLGGDCGVFGDSSFWVLLAPNRSLEFIKFHVMSAESALFHKSSSWMIHLKMNAVIYKKRGFFMVFPDIIW